MQHKQKLWSAIGSSIAILALILDSKTALQGAKEGITLCLYTVIPSLFPIIVMSTLLSSCLLGGRIPLLRLLGRLCGVPEGAESLLLLGFLGGYPVGAQLVADIYRQGYIRRNTAHRLLGFCSNAGPAFIFGIVGLIFSSKWIPLALWLIHIASALAVGALLPGKESALCHLKADKTITPAAAMERGLRIMASICGWVIIFRVILAVVLRWIIWLVPIRAQILIAGLLEISNGCLALVNLPLEGQRFVCCAVILALGGVCVLMQTSSVVGDLGLGTYLRGKVLQSVLSFLLAGVSQQFLFSSGDRANIPVAVYVGVLFAAGIIVWILIRKKSSSNLRLNTV